MEQELQSTLERMAHSRLNNYVIAGLDSSLIGGDGFGKVRLFENEREHLDNITPHSHRFAFSCLILKGSVVNTIWTKNEKGDLFIQTDMAYSGKVGKLERDMWEEVQMSSHDYRYQAGDWYHMDAREIHHIHFSKGAVVLFFEAPPTEDTSVIIEPLIHGEHIKTYEVKPWMFQHG